MIKLLTIICLVFAGQVLAAPWSVPSGGAITGGYSVGTSSLNGVEGGIPARTNLIDVTQSPYFADNTGATDARAAIQDAVDANVGTENAVYLPPGEYRVNGYVKAKTGTTIRGAGRASTVVKPYGGTGFFFGDDPNWDSPGATGTFSASKGDTVLSVSGITGGSFSNGKMILFEWTNDDPQWLGLVPQTSGPQTIYWIGIITSGGGTGTLTVQPSIPFDLTGGTVTESQIGVTYRAGVEDLTIDGTDAANMSYGVKVDGVSRECWVKNVDVKEGTLYPITVQYTHRFEIGGSRVYPSIFGGSNHSGLLMNACSRAYVYNNIITGNGPNIELNQGNYGSIFAYNYIDRSAYSADINFNHGPYNMYLLFEGNSTPNMQADGYFGGIRWSVIYRNWLTGVSGTTPVSFGILNKWSRDTYITGNMQQSYGLGFQEARWSLGNPNISNADYNGTTSVFGVKGELTTRGSDTAGTVTVASGHGVTTGATIDVYWLEITGGYGVTYIRRGVTVGTVTSTTIPFSGGVGDVLPVVNNTDFYVPTSNTALQQYPIDYDVSVPSPWYWTGVLTTRTNGYQGVITVDSGSLSTFSTSLAESSGGNKETLISPGFGPMTGTLSGDEFTFSVDNSSVTLPSVSTAITMGPTTQYNFQEMDMDVIYTAYFANNGSYFTSGPIPNQEFTDGTTLGDSLYLSAKPDWFGSIAWPPFGPSLQPAAYGDVQRALIPAGWRYAYGNENYLGGGSTATVTNLNVGTIRLAP